MAAFGQFNRPRSAPLRLYLEWLRRIDPCAGHVAFRSLDHLDDALAVMNSTPARIELGEPRAGDDQCEITGASVMAFVAQRSRGLRRSAPTTLRSMKRCYVPIGGTSRTDGSRSRARIAAIPCVSVPPRRAAGGAKKRGRRLAVSRVGAGIHARAIGSRRDAGRNLHQRTARAVERDGSRSSA